MQNKYAECIWKKAFVIMNKCVIDLFQFEVTENKRLICFFFRVSLFLFSTVHWTRRYVHLSFPTNITVNYITEPICQHIITVHDKRTSRGKIRKILSSLKLHSARTTNRRFIQQGNMRKIEGGIYPSMVITLFSTWYLHSINVRFHYGFTRFLTKPLLWTVLCRLQAKSNYHLFMVNKNLNDVISTVKCRYKKDIAYLRRPICNFMRNFYSLS